MTLHLVPPGRGRWRALVITTVGDRALPLLIRVGDRLQLGGQVFRISKVLP